MKSKKLINKMNKKLENDEVIFNFFKQLCDEKNDLKCIQLGKDWIFAMEKNLSNIEYKLENIDKIKFKENIKNNKDHLNNLKKNNAAEWREYATQCMIELIDNKKIN